MCESRATSWRRLFQNPRTLHKGFFYDYMKAITLTRGFHALVDDEDFEELSKHKWYAWVSKHTCYAKRTININGKKTSVSMHRKILGITDSSIHVDHIDGNGLNNTRLNIRPCSCAENQMNRRAQKNNSSGFKGVTWDKRDRKWKAYIRVNKSQINLGYFQDKNKAAEAYDKAAKLYHGDFANLNLSNR